MSNDIIATITVPLAMWDDLKAENERLKKENQAKTIIKEVKPDWFENTRLAALALGALALWCFILKSLL